MAVGNFQQANQRARASHASVFWNQDGFSTVGMVLALLITLSLLFTAARVYEINSRAADVQDVADAAALAAENVVAEYYVLAQMCDAIVLTLTLGELAIGGIGVVAACIPPTKGLSQSLFKAAEELRKARDSFAERATNSLERLQDALPLFATVKAGQVFSANSGQSGASYHGVVLLAPFEGEQVEEPTYEQADGALQAADEAQDELFQAAQEAEAAAEAANQAKLKGFMADCGNNPSYCMYERAGHLSGMTGSQNPYFASVDTWSFQVALARAQAYYPKRAANEHANSANPEEVADSVVRKRFYEYASQQVAEGYVHETDSSFSANFPLLPKNTQEMKATPLYTQAVYPITQSATGEKTMHAYPGCPGAAEDSQVGTGSISQLDAGTYTTCPHCRFTVSSMGKVAAASTNIENGFEHHYRIVAEAAAEYQKAREALDPASQEVKQAAQGFFDGILDGLEEAFNKRIEVQPPGRLGAIALVVDTSSHSSVGVFASTFVNDAGSLGMRVAISASTLVEDSPDEGKNVLNSALDGLHNEVGVQPGAVQVVLDVWAGLLHAYTEGYQAVLDGVQQALDGIPLISASGLGTWARDALGSTLERIGLQPPELASRKAVLVNSAHVLSADSSSGFSAGLLSAKQAFVQVGAQGSLFGAALSQVQSAAIAQVDAFGQELELGTIQIFDGTVSIPITIALPSFITNAPKDAIAQGIGWLQGVVADARGGREWK